MAERYAVLRLWMRLGDSSDYESFGTDLDAVVDQLREAGVHDVAQTRAGITAPGFEGDNYISLYWGDSNAQLLRRLTKGEFVKLRRALAGSTNPKASHKVEVWRRPTKSEIKFGYGALHYKDITVRTPPRGGQKFKIDGQTWTYGSAHNPRRRRSSRHKHTRANRKRGLFSRVPLWAWIGAAAAAWVVKAKLSSKGTGL